MDCSSAVFSAIPHRPPFLWVDRIIKIGDRSIETEKEIHKDLDLFRGHYPDYPIMPGVILCEAVFQTGGILIADILSRRKLSDSSKNIGKGVPILTRIHGARFKREVRPGDVIRMTAKLKEIVEPAWFLRGKVLVQGKTAVTVDFACAITDPAGLSNVSK